MADQKITQLIADAAPTSDDLVATVHDPAGTPVTRKATLAAIFGAGLDAVLGFLGFKAETELTIATGAITVTQTVHTVDTEADAASDDLDTINGLSDGQQVILRPANDARSVVVKHNTGNILCVGNADFTLDDQHDFVVGFYVGALSKVICMFGAGGGGGSGETNTASNVGTAGVGVFKQKTGVDLELKKINAGSSKVTITDDVGNSEVDVDVVPSNIDHDALLNFLAAEHLDWAADGVGTVHINNIQDANLTQQGVSELATAAETTTGTDAARAVTPDGLAGSDFGKRVASIQVIAGTDALAIGDGQAYLRIPAELNGYNLVGVAAAVVTKSTSGTPTVQIARGRQSSPTTAHSFVDMLSTLITIDSNEYDSKDAASAAVINTANDDVATGDLIRVDVDVAGTGTQGLIVTLIFQLP